MAENSNSNQPKRGLKTYVIWAAIGLAVLIVLPFVLGIGIAIFADPQPTAIRFGMIRDIMIIVLALQGILVILALSVLILQVARLIALVQNEVKPILKDTQETVETTKKTAQFVGKNVTQPIVGFASFFSGVLVLVRELFGIRRALRSTKPKEELKESSENVKASTGEG